MMKKMKSKIHSKYIHELRTPVNYFKRREYRQRYPLWAEVVEMATKRFTKDIADLDHGQEDKLAEVKK